MFWRKTNIFIFCCLFFILGILLASFWGLLVASVFLYFCYLNFLFLVLFVFWKFRAFRITILLLGFFVFGIYRYLLTIPEIDNSQISFYNGEAVEIKAEIIKEVEIVNNKQSFVVQSELMNGRKVVTGKILVRTGAYPSYHYGDLLQIDCLLAAPEEFSGFAYDRYLSRDAIYSICRYGEIEYLGKRGSGFYKYLLDLKNKLREKINLNLVEPQATMLRAIILGDKKQISDELRETFSRVGISHVMAISGMHIGIICGLVIYFSLLIGLWRRQAYVVATVFLIFYIIIIGMPASAVRAGLMMGFLMFTMYLGRLKSIFNSLLLVACIILFYNPRLLRDDLGFQLSFLAVLGIVYFFPVIKNVFTFRKNIFLERGLDIVLVSFSAQILTMPLIVYHFSIVSPISLLANLCILVLLPSLLSLSILALSLAFILPELASWIFLPIELILRYILVVSDTLLRISGAYFERGISGIEVFVYYFLVTLVWFFFKFRENKLIYF